MSNNSWRQYGGIRKHETMQNLSIGTLVADKVILREKTSEILTFTENLILAGVNITINAPGKIIATDVDLSGALFVKDDVTVGDKLYFGGTNSDTNYFYKFGEYLGLNTTDPSSTFDIVPISSSTQNVLTVRSSTTTNRNIIAQNGNAKGIAVTANDTNSYIDLFNATTTASSNTPDVRLKSDNTGTFTIDASINTFSSRTSTMINSLTTMDLSGNGNIKISSNGNIKIVAKTGIDVSTNDGFKINADTLFSITSPMTTIYSALQLTNRDTSANIFDETAIIYDTSSGTYFYDIYGKSTAYTGTAMTMVSNDNSSNTFMKIVSPNKLGLALGGGAYTYDNTRSMATMGLLDTTGRYYPTQTIVKGNSNLKYYSTLGINKYVPTTENYILDINGATRITNGEINTVLDASFEIKHVAFSKTVPTFGIAVGTPSSITTSQYYQYIYYTSNGGLTWTQSRVDSTSNSLEVISKNLNIYIYDNSYSIIGTSSSFLYFTKNGGVNWYKLTLLPTTTPYHILNVFIQNTSSSTKRIFFGYNTSSPDITTSSSIGYYDLNFSSLSNSSFTISSFSSISPSNTTINFVDGYSTYVYYVGIGIQKYTISNSTLSDSKNTSYTYNCINVYNDTTAIAVGDDIISYTSDGTYWTNLTTYSYIFKSVYIYNSYYAVAVATNGVFLYTKDGYATWSIVPDTLLNSGGNSTNINGSTNSLFSVAMTDINTFIISKIIQTYSTGSQFGSSKIMCAYLPNLFNRSNNNVLDVSGTMVISGDLNIKHGGNLYVNYDTSLNGNLYVLGDASFNSRLIVGSDTTINKRLFTIGDSSLNGNLFVAYDSSLNSRLVVGGDLTVNSRLIVKKDFSLAGNITLDGVTTTGNDLNIGGRLVVLYDTSLNSRMVAGSDITVNKRLFVLGDTSLNSNLFVGYDTSFNGNLRIAKDLTVNGRLNVQNYTNTNIINTTTTNYQLIVSEDLSLNGRMVVSGDISLNGNLYVNDYLLVNTTTTISDVITNINGNMIVSRIGIGTSSVSSGYSLDISGNIYNSNGCIFQF